MVTAMRDISTSTIKGQNIQVNDVTVAGQDVKDTFKIVKQSIVQLPHTVVILPEPSRNSHRTVLTTSKTHRE